MLDGDNPDQLPPHELHDSIASTTREIQDDYRRIKTRVLEDPGTAGDKGEESWKELFEDWLSPNFHVVTKGRITNHNGETSRQMDVMILHPDYPRRLIRKKTYLSAGVLAAFECKLTLRKDDIYKTLDNSAQLRRLLPSEFGTPYKELNSSIVYGLLAHSHRWMSSRSKPITRIDEHLRNADKQYIKHPREMLDILCIANLGTCVSDKQPRQEELNCPATTYSWYPSSSFSDESDQAVEDTTSPIGQMIYWLMYKLAWRYPSLRSLVDYYFRTRIQASVTRGIVRCWKWSIYSGFIREKLKSGATLSREAWNEWAFIIA